MLILAINPGATSIKAAIFQDEQELTRSVVRFDTDLLQSFQPTRNKVIIGSA